jgi:nitrite reductase/ring-hydroxylating ferredoxin subunit
LVYTLRVGVDAEVPVVADGEWHEACRAADLVEDHPFGVTVDGNRIVLVRRRGEVYALAAVCSHAGGPLDRGEVHGAVIQCPWHGSEFCLYDGSVMRGPAASAQPGYATRVTDGAVYVRLADVDVIDLEQVLA